MLFNVDILELCKENLKGVSGLLSDKNNVTNNILDKARDNVYLPQV